MTKFELVQ